jgi:hypothetical protein
VIVTLFAKLKPESIQPSLQKLRSGAADCLMQDGHAAQLVQSDVAGDAAVIYRLDPFDQQDADTWGTRYQVAAVSQGWFLVFKNLWPVLS